jgi:hypothetical protein
LDDARSKLPIQFQVASKQQGIIERRAGPKNEINSECGFVGNASEPHPNDLLFHDYRSPTLQLCDDRIFPLRSKVVGRCAVEIVFGGLSSADYLEQISLGIFSIG